MRSTIISSITQEPSYSVTNPSKLPNEKSEYQPSDGSEFYTKMSEAMIKNKSINQAGLKLGGQPRGLLS